MGRNAQEPCETERWAGVLVLRAVNTAVSRGRALGLVGGTVAQYFKLKKMYKMKNLSIEKR